MPQNPFIVSLLATCGSQLAPSPLSVPSMKDDESRLTKSSMINGARSDDMVVREDAWIRMTSIYGPIVHRQVRRTNVASSEVPDVVQTVFFKAAMSIDAYHHNRDRHGSFRAWLFGITNNVVMDYFRKSAKTPMVVGGTDSTLIEDKSADFDSVELEWEPNPESVNSTTTFAHKAIDNIKSDFSTPTWQCFWRTVVQGESAKNIGEDLGLQPAAVRQAKFRVLKRLREELDSAAHGVAASQLH